MTIILLEEKEQWENLSKICLNLNTDFVQGFLQVESCVDMEEQILQISQQELTVRKKTQVHFTANSG